MLCFVPGALNVNRRNVRLFHRNATAMRWKNNEVQKSPADARNSRKKGGLKPGIVLGRKDARARRNTRQGPVMASWAGVTLAESDDYEFVEGRFYFPTSSVRWENLRKTEVTKTHNPIGRAVYYDVVAKLENGRTLVNKKAAWSYKNLKSSWACMEGCTAFWKGVKITYSKQPSVQKEENIDDVSSITSRTDAELRENGLA